MSDIVTKGKSAYEIHVGENVRRLRKRRSLTQDELALRIDKPQHWVSQIENQRRLPSIENLVLLAIGLRTTIGHLVKWSSVDLPLEEIPS